MEHPSVDNDLLRQPSFDDSARMAASLTKTPMAAISLLGKTCQWFKAEVGLNIDSTPIEEAFCAHTAAKRDVMVVPDAHLDPRFADNPLVTSGVIRSYAGAPLVMHDGTAIGALCVLDTVPREFDERDVEFLRVLARQVVVQLQLESLIDRQATTISDLEELQRELDFQASHDPLTGLLNRRGLECALNLLVRTSDPVLRPGLHSCVSSIFVDLDGFKLINDEFGHRAGDAVLKAVADRLTEALGEAIILARLGGDEFVIGMMHEPNCGPSPRFLEWLLDVIAEPVIVEGVTLALTASVGLATMPSQSMNAEELIDRADHAMYSAKQYGGDSGSFWSPQIHDRGERDRELRALVRKAIDADEVFMAFQPVVDLRTGTLVRREALVRWEGFSTADATPTSFVAAAENSGQIHELGRVALTRSCEAAASWQGLEPGVGVAVNVSPSQIVGRFVDDVGMTLAEHGLDPSLLTLELTESSCFERSVSAIGVLHDLRNMGVRISLDDFGTGYSSMSMLCGLPISEAKIDRQFCSGESDQLMTVARAAIDLSHALGLTVVAEGIETPEVLDQLIELGCDAGQGFLLGRPGPVPKQTVAGFAPIG